MFSDKRHSLDLLLLVDEQEDTLDRYLERGEMFTLYDGGELRAARVVANEGEGIYELGDIVTYPEGQHKGYGRYLVEFLFRRHSDRCSIMFAGTGDTPHSPSFYQSCGLVPFHHAENFFTDHYDRPIRENGILLRDTTYLKRGKLQ